MSTVNTKPGTYSLEKGWKTLVISGGVVALLGLLAVMFPLVTGVAVTYIVGGLLVASGIVHGGHAFTARGWSGRFWQLALAVVSVIAGLVLLVNPIVGLASLTLLVIAYLIVDGATELGVSYRMESGSGRGWIAGSGALSLILAVFLLAGFPADAAWAIGLLVGVSLLVTGLSMIAVAYGGRQFEDDTKARLGASRGA